MQTASATVPGFQPDTSSWTVQRYVTPTGTESDVFVTDAEIRTDDTGRIRVTRASLNGDSPATELVAEWSPAEAPDTFNIALSEIVDGQLTLVAEITTVDSRLATPEEEACAAGCGAAGLVVGIVVGTVVGGTVCSVAGIATAGAALFICGAAASTLGAGVGQLTTMTCSDQCNGAPNLSKDPEVSVQCRSTGSCSGVTTITRENQQSMYVVDADTTLTWNYLQNNKTEVHREGYRFDDSAMNSAYSFEYYPDDIYYYRAVLQTPYVYPSTTARVCAASVEAATGVTYYNGDSGYGMGSRNVPPTSRAADLGSC